MSKKFTTIEEQLTEGFWDAILNKAKRAGLAAGAALGSNHTRGKLDANTFATELYDKFKLWQGQTNMPSDMSSVAMFLKKQINMDSRFIKSETGVDIGGSNGNQGQQQAQQGSSQGGNSHDFEDPLGHVGGNAGSQNGNGGNDAQSNYKPEGNDFKPVMTAVGEFMRYGQYGAFKRARDATGFDKNATKVYTTPFDGSFIFSVGTDKNTDLEELLKQAEAEGSDIADVVTGLKDMFGTWEDFKKSVQGGDRIEKNSKDEADLFRQAVTQASKLYHYNFPKNLNRFVLASPPPVPDKQAARKELFFNDGDPTAKTTESVLNTDDVLMEAGGISDGQLRKHFMQIAQHALRDGEFKIAANNTIHMLQGDNVVGNAVQTNAGNNGNTGDQNGNSQPTTGSILNKAESLGHVLGIDINEFTLLKFKKKDMNTYREFMGFLNKQKGDSFTDPFLTYAKETLEPYYDFSEAKPDPKANKDVNGAENAPQANKTADGANSPVADPVATDENGLKFYDIDRRQMAWDPKNEMLLVRSTKNGKVNERTYKRTDDGWVNDRDAAVQEKNIKLVDSWYDRVMAKSGGEAAQDTQPATPAKVDPTVIPNGAVVTNPKNKGEYKFDGKSWRAGNGAEIPEGPSADALTKLYHEQRGTTPKSTAPQANTQAADKQPANQGTKPASPAVEPGQNTPERGAKVTVPSTGAEYTFDGAEWEDAKGDAIMAPSGHHKDTNGDDYSSQKYLTRLYNFEKTGGNAEDFTEPVTSRLKLDAPKAQKPPAADQPKQQEPQPATQPKDLTTDEEDAVVNSKPEANVGNDPVPVDAKLSHDGNTARKLKRGAWWNETTKKPYPDDKTQEIDNLYRKSLAAKNGAAIPPASAKADAPDGSDFKLGGGVQYKKENGQWKNMALNKPITDPKTAQHLEIEFAKQKDKKGSGTTLTKAANDDSESAAPTGAKFKQNDKGVEYTRTKDGWVDPNGKVIDNESQVALMDRGYNNAKNKGGLAA